MCLQIFSPAKRNEEENYLNALNAKIKRIGGTCKIS